MLSFDGETLPARVLRACFKALTAALIGALVGVAIGVFGRVLGLVTEVRGWNYYLFAPLLPLAGLAVVWLYERLSPESAQGMGNVFDAYRRRREDIPAPQAPLIMAATWLSHLFGGSAGREGAAVQIGAGVANMTARRLRLPFSARYVLITGMAAGFAGLFQTPLTALFFAMELVTSGVVEYGALLPALIAAYASKFVAFGLGIRGDFFQVADALALNFSTLWRVALLGVLFGLAGRLFALVMEACKHQVKKLIPNPYARIGLLAIPLAGLMMLFHGRYAGAGGNLIELAFEGAGVRAWDWLLKMLFTAATLAIGFQGGEVAPLFTVGATLGFTLGSLLGLPPVAAAALGYAAVFAGGTNTLIAPLLITAEAFSGANMVPAALACLIAYLVNGNTSIYAKQEIFSKPD